MKRCLASLGATIALVLAICAGPALAGSLPTLPTTTSGASPQTQRSDQVQSATNSVDQNANSDATSAPGVQSNTNAPVSTSGNSCCGGGDSGDVNQSNDSTANSEAENNNTSTQGITQGQTSGQQQGAEQGASDCCNGSPDNSGQPQPSKEDQKAKNDVDQNANSPATSAPATQPYATDPGSSDGSSGDVNQSNGSTANSEAENNNNSTQGINQGQSSTQDQTGEQGGGGCCNPCDTCNPCNQCNQCNPCNPCNPCDPCCKSTFTGLVPGGV